MHTIQISYNVASKEVRSLRWKQTAAQYTT